jgi:hypothetical protein
VVTANKGTGIELHGTANCTFDVTVDGIFSSSLSTPSNVLYSNQALSEGTHSLTLTAHPTSEQQLAFENAVIYIEYVNGQYNLFRLRLNFPSVKQSPKWYHIVIRTPRSSTILGTGPLVQIHMFLEVPSILRKPRVQVCPLHSEGHRRWSYRVL